MAGGISPGISTTVSWAGSAFGTLVSWDGPKYSRETIETTTIGVATGSHFRTYKKGVSDAPEMNITVQFDADDVGVVAAMAELQSDVWSAADELILTFNDAGIANATDFTVNAALTSADWSGQEIDGIVLVAFTAKFLGKPAYTPSADS